MGGGTQNKSYTRFERGSPPAAKFAIAGIDACPKAKDCSVSTWQAHRLAARRFRAYEYWAQ